MKEAFDLPSRFVYPFKQSYDEYKHEGLNLFLEKMYKLALKEGCLEFKDPLQAFNTAYYIAAALNITPHLDLRVMKEQMDAVILEQLGDSPLPFPPGLKPSHIRIPLANRMLVRWMVYAILFLQENKTAELDDYLDMYRGRLEKWAEAYFEDNPDSEDIIDFVIKFPNMIASSQERYSTNLYPNLKVAQLTEGDWKNHISDYDDKTVDLLMTFFRTKEEQHRFLDWMDEMNMMYGDESDV